MAKAADVITYIEHGVCDIGVVGKDTIVENGASFYEVTDLGFGRCRFALAGPVGKDFFTQRGICCEQLIDCGEIIRHLIHHCLFREGISL